MLSMETKSIRIGEWTLKEVREIGKEFGSPSDDAVLRQIVDGYKSRGIEIELLKKKLEECEKTKARDK